MPRGVRARAFLDPVIGEGAYDELPPPIQAAKLDNAAELGLHLEAGQAEADWPPFFCEDARNVRVPTLLLSGERSPAMFHRITDELARCLPMVDRATLPGVSHDLWNPPVFSETVLGFLAKH